MTDPDPNILKSAAKKSGGSEVTLLSDGLEMEQSAELERSIGPHIKEIIGDFNTWVPGSAFNTRVVSVAGSGSALGGSKTRQAGGILGWSSVVRSSAAILGPLTDSNLRVFHDQQFTFSAMDRGKRRGSAGRC